MTRAVLLAAVLALLAADAPKSLAVRVTPRFGMAGQPLSVSVLVARDARNRQLATVVDCELFFRSWQEQLSVRSPYQRVTVIQKMPTGRCVVAVRLFRVEDDQIVTLDAEDWACFSGMGLSCAQE